LRIFFPKSVEKIQVLLKSDKNNGCFTWRPIYIFDYTCRSIKYSQSEKCFRQNLLKKKKHFILNSFFRKSVEKIQVLLKCDRNKGYFT
jgi:hypothetical protein